MHPGEKQRAKKSSMIDPRDIERQNYTSSRMIMKLPLRL